MEVPDVTGFILDDALAEIKGKGFEIDKILITKPVKAAEPIGVARVIRVSRVTEEKLLVIVAYQDYMKGGVHYGI